MEAALNGVKYDEFLEELKTLSRFFPGHFTLLLSSICRQIPGTVELLLHHFRQLLHEVLAPLIAQQILDGLFFQAGNHLHGVDGVLHSLTDM